MIQRFVCMPMFLFTGTCLPARALPDRPAVDRLDLAALARHPARAAGVATGREPIWLTVGARVVPPWLCVVGLRMTRRVVSRRLNR